MLSACLLQDFKSYEQWLRFNGMSSNTIISYLSDLKLSLYCDDHIMLTQSMLENFSEDDFREIFAKLQDRVSYKSHERYFAAWRSYCMYKKESGIFLSMQNLPALRQKNSSYIPNINIEDIDLFLNYFDQAESWQEKRNKALVYLLYSVGLRVNEALNLSWNDLFCKYIKILGKGGKIRSVPLFPCVKMFLNDYKLSLKVTSDFIFVSKNKKSKWQASSVARIFRDVCENLQLKSISPHVLRHACATYLLKAGCNLRSIQSLLGHSSLEITKKYINSSLDELQDEYFKIL